MTNVLTTAANKWSPAHLKHSNTPTTFGAFFIGGCPLAMRTRDDLAQGLSQSNKMRGFERAEQRQPS
jgi:hypothetical protein